MNETTAAIIDEVMQGPVQMELDEVCPKEPAEPEPITHYAGLQEHLGDYFDAMTARDGEKKGDRKPTAKFLPLREDKKKACGPILPFLEALARIRTREAVSREVGVSLPLLAVQDELHLKEREVMILVELLYIDLCLKENNPTEKELINRLSDGSWKDALEIEQLLMPDAPLIVHRLINPPDRERYVRSYSLESKFRARLLGIKAPTVKKRYCGSVKLSSDPALIYEQLSEWVIGQDNAKKRIAIALSSHLRRADLPVTELRQGKSNILLSGPSGSGKTHLCRTIARLLDSPMVIADATQYTETGYVGKEIDSVFSTLFAEAGHDPRIAERGIIFIDEVDKIASRAAHGHRTDRDVSGDCVQDEMLTMLEGNEDSRFDTSRVLFIAGGAFSDMADFTKKKVTGGSGIGFLQKNNPTLTQHSTYTSADFIAYGMKPELMGRFPVVIQLDPLSIEELEAILCGTGAPLLDEYHRQFEQYGGLELTPAAIRRVAQLTQAKGLGARGLRSVLEETLSPLLFDRVMKQFTGKLVVTEQNFGAHVCKDEESSNENNRISSIPCRA